MTVDEIDGILNDAIAIALTPRARIIALVFANEYEADNCYTALKEYFLDKPLVLRIYKKSDSKVDLIISHKQDFVKALNLDLPSIPEDSLNDFIQNEDVHEKLTFTMAFKFYLQTISGVNRKNSENRSGLNILRWELS